MTDLATNVSRALDEARDRLRRQQIITGWHCLGCGQEYVDPPPPGCPHCHSPIGRLRTQEPAA